nr:hypothetical protein [Pseudopedobacter sp.]
MKPNQNEKAWLDKLVYQNVKYNETYYEVIDHVISALENEKDENITFHQKLNQIWDEDFGGYENLPFLEKQREKEVNKQIAKRRLEIFKSYFKLPLIIGTFTFSIAFYFVSYYFFSNTTLFFILIFSFAAPSLISWVMYWKTKQYNFIKPSIKNKKITRSRDLAYRIIYLPIAFSFAFLHVFYNFSIKIDQIFSPLFVILITIFILHNSSYFRLYKETFKMELSK